MDFSDSNGTFYTHYETFRHESDFMQDRKQLVDIIITGKVCPIFSTFLELKHGVFFFWKQTDDQYLAAWGASSKILGRVRLVDGLIILSRTSHVRVTLSMRSLGRFPLLLKRC